MLYNIIFILFSCITLSGCTTLNLSNAIPEIEAPTFQGNNRRIGFEVAAAGGKDLIVSDDPSKRPLVTNVNNLKTSTAFYTKTGIAWYFNNNISFTGGIMNSSIVYLKSVIRLFGNYREEPESGLFYLSVNLETTYQYTKSSGDTNGAGGAGGYPWEGNAQNISGTSGATFGYQFFKKAAPFIGYNFQRFQTSGNVKQLISSNGSDAGGTYDLGNVTGTTEVMGIGVEYRPKSRFFITPVIQYYNMKWGGNNIKDLTGSIRFTYVPI